jgi:exoribonuclease-2
MPAYLDLIPAPHAGLGVPVYLQATSPLRRYPDLVMQRQISHYIVAGKELYAEEEIASVAQRAEVQLRELMGIEEQRKRYWFIKFLEQSLDRGQENRFAAVVLENEPRQLALLELVEYPFRLRADLQRPYEPGEVATLRLCGVDKWRRVGQWVHTNDCYKGPTQNRTDVGIETARGTL